MQELARIEESNGETATKDAAVNQPDVPVPVQTEQMDGAPVIQEAAADQPEAHGLVAKVVTEYVSAEQHGNNSGHDLFSLPQEASLEMDQSAPNNAFLSSTAVPSEMKTSAQAAVSVPVSEVNSVPTNQASSNTEITKSATYPPNNGFNHPYGTREDFGSQYVSFQELRNRGMEQTIPPPSPGPLEQSLIQTVPRRKPVPLRQSLPATAPPHPSALPRQNLRQVELTWPRRTKVLTRALPQDPPSRPFWSRSSRRQAEDSLSLLDDSLSNIQEQGQQLATEDREQLVNSKRKRSGKIPQTQSVQNAQNAQDMDGPGDAAEQPPMFCFMEPCNRFFHGLRESISRCFHGQR